MYISQMLRAKRIEKGLTQQELADRVGVSSVAISKWELGSANPRPKYREKLSDVLGINEKVLSGIEKVTKSDYVEIPYYDVKAAAGHGCENEDPYESAVELVPIEALKYSQRSSVFCMVASGDSMTPVFCDGAKLAIDSSKTIVKDGDLYVVSYDGCLRVKVLFNILNGIRLCSYNPMFKDEEYTHEELASFKVIGKVIWYSQVISGK
ncbi:XRE family transcriptional regulator (plasmid) [Vibrio alfacsensis]|uniref:XRE family transcriptional regulator n=1 Tax=Vibrio alfacsensis TaxID=1074311 RepID=UPI002ADD7C57|nr:XRE family transcriptional regulator [Vibrio alfacsensis]WQE79458.1 XRE family transcriptional regulator [Vibrio alfacsensis]